MRERVCVREREREREREKRGREGGRDSETQRQADRQTDRQSGSNIRFKLNLKTLTCIVELEDTNVHSHRLGTDPRSQPRYDCAPLPGSSRVKRLECHGICMLTTSWFT